MKCSGFIFNVAYNGVMLNNYISSLVVQKHIAHWRKKKINRFRNKSIPIEENCQYFPELSFSNTLLLLLYILSLYERRNLCWNTITMFDCFCYRKMYPSLQSFFIQNNKIKISRNKNFSIFVIEVSSLRHTIQRDLGTKGVMR